MAGGTTWTDERRAKHREGYARNYATCHAGRAQGITVPDDIERREEHAPCNFCGVARAICRHRPWMLANG